MSIKYKKVNPSEFIDIGDILMVSPKNQRVTKAIRDRHGINERLVVGVVTKSDNTTPMPILVDGGLSKSTERVIICGGNSKISIIPLIGGSSKSNPREFVEIETNGIETVGIDDKRVAIGDKLTISRFTAGKAERRKISNTNPSGGRSIGKVINKIDKEHVNVLLNIE